MARSGDLAISNLTEILIAILLNCTKRYLISMILAPTKISGDIDFKLASYIQI